jgi:hypothetical protein
MLNGEVDLAGYFFPSVLGISSVAHMNRIKWVLRNRSYIDVLLKAAQNVMKSGVLNR